MSRATDPSQKKAPDVGCHRPEGENPTPHERNEIMTSITNPVAESNPTQAPTCAYEWCHVDHEEAPGLHIKEWVRGRLRLDFVLEDQTGSTSLSWVDMFDFIFTPTELDEIDELTAAMVAARADFEAFTAEVTR